MSVTAAYVICVVLMAATQVEAATELKAGEAAEIATEAYIFGYPLITFDMVRRQETNVVTPTGEAAPMGQVIKMRSYPPAESHAAAAPNADTLYTMIWLDLSLEPWVIGIPDMGDRYYIVPMHDGYSEVFHAVSSILTGSGPHSYALTGPGWEGDLPAGVIQVKSPTSMVWVLGRIYCLGTPEDYAAVHALQDKFSVVPLSAWGKPYTPPPGKVDPDLDMKTAVRNQVNSMDVETYFDYLARLMVDNPPHPEDAPIVERMARIGLAPGQDFDPSKLSPEDRDALQAVPKLAMQRMGMRLKKKETTNGWLYWVSGVGNFGTDYELRGMANLLGPGWNRPQDATYPISKQDAEGQPYDGAAYNYVMRFEKGKLPPVEAFWSLTLYDADMFFVPNPINRYALSQRDSLKANPDGSIDLYIQAVSPGKDKESNWLPSPRGAFNLVMRLYGPTSSKPSILDGSWVPPPVIKTGE